MCNDGIVCPDCMYGRQTLTHMVDTETPGGVCIQTIGRDARQALISNHSSRETRPCFFFYVRTPAVHESCPQWEYRQVAYSCYGYLDFMLMNSCGYVHELPQESRYVLPGEFRVKTSGCHKGPGARAGIKIIHFIPTQRRWMG